MGVNQISISKDNPVYPVLLWQTSGQTTLNTGLTQLFKLEKINRNQIVRLFKAGIEAHDNSFWSLVVDGQKRDAIHTLSTGGTNTPLEMGHGHELAIAEEELIAQISNNGSSDTDSRQSIQYMVDAADTIRKIQNGFTLEEADFEAMEFLKRHPEVFPQDPEIAARIGIGVPKTVDALLHMHEHIDSIVQDLGRAITLSTTADTVTSQDVINKGEEALVLEKILVEKTDQAELGEVTIKVYADNDADPIMSLDPSCLAGAPFTTDGLTGSTQNLAEAQVHVPAFEKLRITAEQASGSHATFKCMAFMSRRKIGIGWKAKLQEFLGSNNLPNAIDISSSERALIEKLGLKQLARSGLVQIG